MGMSDEENSTPACEPAGILNHNDTDIASAGPKPMLGSATSEDVPLNEGAMVELPAVGAGVAARLTLLYVPASTPSFASTVLAAVLPVVSASGQYDCGLWSITCV